MGTRPPQKQSLFSLTLPQMRDYLAERGFAKFSSDQIFNWLYKRFEMNMDNWSNVSKKARDHMKEELDCETPKVIWQGLSKDGTRKFLVRMSDGNTVETVAIQMKEWITLCISSQVGCAIGCTFCHTGTMGLKRHLSAGEIVGQYVAVTVWLRANVDPELRISNVVYMGQGEPLHNYENVKSATEIFMENKGIALSQRKITLSTSGLVPQIEKLWDFPPVNLAISLHAAHNDLRTELMPINKAYDLDRLFEAIKKVPLKAARRITYEYILIKDFNDRIEDIRALSNLLKRKESKVNIIPFNEYPGSDFKRPSNEKIVWFQEELLRRNLVCTVRTTKGDDILAACGQLKSMEDKLNLWDEAPAP